MPSLRILIVGGGIAGLALGRALREQGVVSEFIERAASWPTRGTGLYLPGNGIRALGALGLANAVLARAVCMSHQRILDHTGRQLAEIELAELWNRVGLCVGIARGELHRILLEGAAGVPMRLGATVTALSQQDGAVDVAFADGSTGTYDLVVGADGIHSSIRQLVFGSIRPRHLGQVSWRFLVNQSSVIKTWTAMLASRRTFERSRTSGLVQTSGGYETFHEYSVGSIELAAGVNRIVMRPDGPLRRELADVRSLRLAPISRQP